MSSLLVPEQNLLRSHNRSTYPSFSFPLPLFIYLFIYLSSSLTIYLALGQRGARAMRHYFSNAHSSPHPFCPFRNPLGDGIFATRFCVAARRTMQFLTYHLGRSFPRLFRRSCIRVICNTRGSRGRLRNVNNGESSPEWPTRPTRGTIVRLLAGGFFRVSADRPPLFSRSPGYATSRV